MAKIEKVIKIETIKCDFCEGTNEYVFMYKCDLCNKDICRYHTYEIKHLKDEGKTYNVCPTCIAKLGLKLKEE